MGFWDGVRDRLGIDDPFAAEAHRVVARVRRQVRSVHGRDPEVVRPLEAAELKLHISGKNEQGGLHVHKQALAYWQIFRAVYPEWITEADRPKFTAECWRDPTLKERSH